MKISRIIVSLLIFGIPAFVFFLLLTGLSAADSDEEPYSIYIIAGQSQAEGSNSFRDALENDSLGFDKYSHEGDDDTGFWWAGADGKGPDGLLEFISLFYSGNTVAGWTYSGWSNVDDGAVRLKDLSPENSQKRSESSPSKLFGPEYGVARTLYDKGRRKVIILKVSYGFQSLAQSNSPLVPYDWNVKDFETRNKSYKVLDTEFKRLTDYITNDLGQKYTVDGFFWHQGGTDTLDPEYASDYNQNFDDLVNDARIRFKLQPDAHFVAAKISYQHCVDYSIPPNETTPQYCGFPYLKELEPFTAIDLLNKTANRTAHAKYTERINLVRAALQDVADQYSWVDVVDNGDLTRSSDNIHLNELAQLEMGKRFVEMYRLPYRPAFGGPLQNDYDNDGILNSQEDSGRGVNCQIELDGQVVETANNGNLGDDDTDCDGYPDYVDALVGPGRGFTI